MKGGSRFLLMGLTGMLAVCISGCGDAKENGAQELQIESMEEEAEDTATEETEAPTAQTSIEGIIEEQSFEIYLDDWGEVFFASMYPSDESGRPEFVLIRDDEIVYTFPEPSGDAVSEFVEVGAVAFRDYNMDGKTDVLVLVTYRDGESTWNEPCIFLQEYSDNMFYLDHPELESYRIEGKTENGPSFYRDRFLEEYLDTQKRTESVADFADSWEAYVDYADSLSGILSVERQIDIFAKNRAVWIEDIEYADDRYCVTAAGLTNDGRPTLIVANQGGTGNYTYSRFYKIDEAGQMKELETSFREGESQPDLIEESMTVYSSWSKEGIRNYFIVYDEVKDTPTTYLYRVSSLNVSDDFVLETPLASQRIVYESEGASAQIIGEDCRGNALTEEEFAQFPDTYYENMGLTKSTAVFQWIDVESLAGMDDEQAAEVLRQVYEGFSLE